MTLSSLSDFPVPEVGARTSHGCQTSISFQSFLYFKLLSINLWPTFKGLAHLYLVTPLSQWWCSASSNAAHYQNPYYCLRLQAQPCFHRAWKHPKSWRSFVFIPLKSSSSHTVSCFILVDIRSLPYGVASCSRRNQIWSSPLHCKCLNPWDWNCLGFIPYFLPLHP